MWHVGGDNAFGVQLAKRVLSQTQLHITEPLDKSPRCGANRRRRKRVKLDHGEHSVQRGELSEDNDCVPGTPDAYLCKSSATCRGNSSPKPMPDFSPAISDACGKSAAARRLSDKFPPRIAAAAADVPCASRMFDQPLLQSPQTHAECIEFYWSQSQSGDGFDVSALRRVESNSSSQHDNVSSAIEPAPGCSGAHDSEQCRSPAISDAATHAHTPAHAETNTCQKDVLLSPNPTRQQLQRRYAAAAQSSCSGGSSLCRLAASVERQLSRREAALWQGGRTAHGLPGSELQLRVLGTLKSNFVETATGGNVQLLCEVCNSESNERVILFLKEEHWERLGAAPSYNISMPYEKFHSDRLHFPAILFPPLIKVLPE